ncbi:LysR family transcriptional regulator [Photobacterium sanguinicancri]|uniref:HTH lysR-type domain-containing protein n=1 Tax=Photobacterium sanguinicancri TaxID=875932 RepID=A0ABX4FVQ8_9GAMM|nr:LysR family transcriptional regulator [Photobacterium sanguinicancri]OZS41905.1 hypothetical protein ASV53_21230 [Photobacterium sanguinicancri]
MIRLELLKSFIAAADTGSFSAAARLMGKHLATVSGNIARLEDELGVVLFDRKGKYPEITAEGLNLYDSAKVVVDSAERFSNNALQLSMGVPAELTLALDQDINVDRIFAALPEFQKKWPHLRLTVVNLSAEDIFEGVKLGKIDLALAPTLEGQSSFYEFMAIGQCSLKMVVGKGHPLARKRHVSNDQLAMTTQILSNSWQSQPTMMQAARMSPYVWFAQGYHGTVDMVRQNLGWSTLMCGNDPIPEGIVELDAEFAQTEFLIQYDAIWPKNRGLRDVDLYLIDAFKGLLKLSVND